MAVEGEEPIRDNARERDTQYRGEWRPDDREPLRDSWDRPRLPLDERDSRPPLPLDERDRRLPFPGRHGVPQDERDSRPPFLDRPRSPNDERDSRPPFYGDERERPPPPWDGRDRPPPFPRDRVRYPYDERDLPVEERRRWSPPRGGDWPPYERNSPERDWQQFDRGERDRSPIRRDDWARHPSPPGRRHPHFPPEDMDRRPFGIDRPFHRDGRDMQLPPPRRERERSPAGRDRRERSPWRGRDRRELSPLGRDPRDRPPLLPLHPEELDRFGRPPPPPDVFDWRPPWPEREPFRNEWDCDRRDCKWIECLVNKILFLQIY